MILLAPKFTENFGKENSKMVDAKQKKDYFDRCFSEAECVKLYNEEYIEVFSPTVFETVEIYTSSSSSDNSENQDFNGDITFLESTDSNSTGIANEVIDSIDTVNSLENLEPGTYTLDVLETSDFDFDTVFVNSEYGQECPLRVSTADENNKNLSVHEASKEKKLRVSEEQCKKYRLRNNYKNSSRVNISPKEPVKNVTARDFLNNFTNHLSKTEKTMKTSPKEDGDESKSLSWLLDFKISSIFHPVECETEKNKRKSNDIQKKPRYTYTELIEQALKENGELTVSGIYNWISNHYPYYQQHDDRWKNSVRHNLSINPQFRKGKKASQGAGHFWNISETISQNIECNNIRKDTGKVISNSTSNSISTIDEEVLAATRSIQESENMEFTDVSLQDAAEQIHVDGKPIDSMNVNTTKNDLEQLWESTNEGDQRFNSFSPLIREIAEETGSSMEEENFLIQDIHNSICLGDELFTNGLNSPYYGLTTI